MSFIEKNKAWLLPLLGLGILGVGYMNFRTPPVDKPPAESASASPEAAPPAEVPPPVPGNDEATEAPGDLWNDLKPFAVLPGNLAQASVLTDRARLALGPELRVDSPLSLGRPTGAALSTPLPKPGGQGASVQAAPGGGLPELDFLIHGPQGSYAWFGGRPYQTGEKLLDSGYTLSRIGPTFVELTGPQGRVVASTNPIHAVVQNPSHREEAP